MNKLSKLREELDLTYEEIAKRTNISITVQCLLENGKREFQQRHLDALSSFYAVTIDYLMGRSSVGYKLTTYDEDIIVVTENQYESYKKDHLIKVVITKDRIVRRFIGNIEEFILTDDIYQKYSNYINILSKEELIKVIKFIETILLK